MKILILTDYFDPFNLAGSIRVITEVTKHWIQQGDEIVLVGGLNETKPSYKFNELKIYPVPYLGREGGLRGLWEMRQKSKKTIQLLLKDFQPDVIWAHQPLITDACLPFIKSFPIYYTFHSSWIDETHSRQGAWKNSLSQFIRGRMEKKSLLHAKGIHVLSDFMIKRFHKLYTDLNHVNSKIIPGGVDYEAFSSCQNTSSIRKKFGIPEGAHWITTARRMVDRMGIDDLIHAIKKIDSPQLIVTAAGKGIMLERYRELVKELKLENQFHLPGFLSPGDLKEMMSASDLFVLPTRELEGFGLATLEALACETPVLATPIGGTREILSNVYPEGLLTGTGPEALSQGLSQINWEQLEKKELNLRQTAKEHYSWDQMAKDLKKWMTSSNLKS